MLRSMSAVNTSLIDTYPNSLSFVPKGTVDPNVEALVGYNGGTYVRIDTVTGAVTSIGNLGSGYSSSGDIVRLPIPGNAELLVYVIAVIVAGIIALTTPEVDGWRFLWAFTLLTIGYVISRGLAKATRVLER